MRRGRHLGVRRCSRSDPLLRLLAPLCCLLRAGHAAREPHERKGERHKDPESGSDAEEELLVGG
jgi:hypothetical protein